MKDLFVSGAHVNDTVEALRGDPYRLPNAVFGSNAGDGTFRDFSAAAGADFQASGAHRGAALADFNNGRQNRLVVSLIGARAGTLGEVSPKTIPGSREV